MSWLRAGLALLCIAVFSLSIYARQDNHVQPDNSIYRYDNPIFKYKTRKEMSDAVVRRVEPIYPPLAKAYLIEDRVNIDVVVNEFGDVVFARAIKGHTLLKDAAIEAVKQWKFKPLKDKKYRMRGTVEMDFSVNNLDRDKELQLYTEQVRQNPVSPDAHHRLGEMLHRNLAYEEAIEEFKNALRIKPDSFITYERMGDAYYGPAFNEKALFEEAIEAYKKAIEYNPDYVEAYFYLGASYKWLRRYEEAIPIFLALTRIRPDLDILDSVYINLSVIYEKAGRIEESLEARKKMIAIEREILTVDSDEALMLHTLAYMLGEDLEKLGRYKEALEAYQAVVAVQLWAPEGFPSYLKVALMYDKLGQRQESEKLYNKVIGQFTSRIYMVGEKSIEAATSYYGLGLVYEQQGKYLDALRAFKEAYRLKPRWNDPKNAIDRVEKKLKEQKK